MSGGDIEVGTVRAVPGSARVGMDHVHFDEIGRAVYGERYKAALARRLDMSATWVRQMATGRVVIPETVALAMLALENLNDQR